MMYGSPAGGDRLDWTWVEDQLVKAGAYWIVAPGVGNPHPRPVWGIWHDEGLFLSIGSPEIKRRTQDGNPVAVHLGSVTDVVIVDGDAAGAFSDGVLLDAYNAKYDWDYSVDEYGPLTRIEPRKVIAWRSAGWAGREGFQETGRWTFGSQPH